MQYGSLICSKIPRRHRPAAGRLKGRASPNADWPRDLFKVRRRNVLSFDFLPFRFLIIITSITTTPTQPSIPCPSLLLHITFQLIQDSSHFCYVDSHDCLVAHSWKPDNSFDLVTISHNSPPRSSAFLLRNIIPFHFHFRWLDQPFFEVVSEGVSSLGLYVSLKRIRLCGGLWVLFVHRNLHPLM